METIDLKKAFKPLYTAKERPEQLLVPAGTFLAVEGKGEPGGAGYQAAIEQLFSTVYTLKFSLKAAEFLDFKVPNLECLWEGEPGATPSSEWAWTLRIRIPDVITAAHVETAASTVREKKGIDTRAVRCVRSGEEPAVQALHVGPYETIGATYERLTAFCADHDLAPHGTAHEVYLSDPRRTAPQRLKTIVRLAVSSVRPSSAN